MYPKHNGEVWGKDFKIVFWKIQLEDLEWAVEKPPYPSYLLGSGLVKDLYNQSAVGSH